MKQVGFFIVPANTKIRRVEHFAQLISHQIHNGLEVQLGGESLLNGVDDLQLGDAFLLGFEEALGLVKETGIFEGSPQRGRDGGYQAQFGVSIGIFPLVVFKLNSPEHSVATDDGNNN